MAKDNKAAYVILILVGLAMMGSGGIYSVLQDPPHIIIQANEISSFKVTTSDTPDKPVVTKQVSFSDDPLWARVFKYSITCTKKSSNEPAWTYVYFNGDENKPFETSYESLLKFGEIDNLVKTGTFYVDSSSRELSSLGFMETRADANQAPYLSCVVSAYQEVECTENNDCMDGRVCVDYYCENPVQPDYNCAYYGHYDSFECGFLEEPDVIRVESPNGVLSCYTGTCFSPVIPGGDDPSEEGFPILYLVLAGAVMMFLAVLVWFFYGSKK